MDGAAFHERSSAAIGMRGNMLSNTKLRPGRSARGAEERTSFHF